MGFKDILQTGADRTVATSVHDTSDAVAHRARCGVVVPHAGPDALVHRLRLIVVETIELSLRLTVGNGVDVLEQCAVGGDKEAVIGIE